MLKVVDSKKRTHSGYNYTADVWSLGITMIGDWIFKKDLFYYYLLSSTKKTDVFKRMRRWSSSSCSCLSYACNIFDSI